MLKSSRYRGVSWDKTHKLWKTVMRIKGPATPPEGLVMTIGYSHSEIKAALLHDKAIRLLDKDNLWKLNFLTPADRRKLERELEREKRKRAKKSSTGR